MKKIIVVGGGASGMMAAITAAKNNAEVTLLEKNERVGKKILATGNGKCNFSNQNMDIHQYYSEDSKRLSSFFDVFSVEDSVAFFENAGMFVKEKDGYLYPFCEQAAVVLDVLRKEMERLSVCIVTDANVTDIKWNHKNVTAITSAGNFTGDALILSCGSLAGTKDKTAGYDLAKKIGHKISKLYPALVQVRCKENVFKSISGVRSKCKIALYEDNHLMAWEQGELQLTDYGISGIPVFQISRCIAKGLDEGKKLSVHIDFWPGYSLEEWEKLCKDRIEKYNGETVEEFLLGMLNKKLCQMFAKENNLKLQDKIHKSNSKQILNMCMHMKQFVVTPTGTNPFENAQVCAGGVLLKEVNDDLSSKYCDCIYLCGEMLDVDGKCGGYNLQWAWTSGYIAGLNATK